MFLYFVRDSPKLTAIYRRDCTTTSIDKQGGIKPRNTARPRNGAKNVKHLAIINLDCQSLKDER